MLFRQAFFMYIGFNFYTVEFDFLMGVVLKPKHLEIRQGEHLIFRDLNFEVRSGEFVYLIGKTGSGKSSLLKSFYADLPIAGGSVEVAGYNLPDIEAKEIPYLRRKLGIVFQDFQLFTDRSIFENLAFVMKAVGHTDKDAIRKIIKGNLELVGLSSKSNLMPHKLSGGEQQRVAVARALLNEPEIIFADEPTGNLDPTVAREILDLFFKVSREKKTAVLMATHNHGFLKSKPARVLYCEDQSIKDLGKDLVMKKMSS